VNAIAKDIYNLNQEVSSVEAGNQNANDSRDRRDQQLKELAKLIDIDVSENEIGQVTVTAAGHALVTPAYIQQLETYSTTFRLPDQTTKTEIGIRLAMSKRAYMPLSGQIKGLFESRDVVTQDYMNELDTIAQTLVAKVNEIHEQGYNLDGFTGIDFFNPDFTGASDIDISASIKSSVHNIAAGLGGSMQNTSDNVTLTFGDPATTLAQRNIARNSVIVTSGAAVLTEGVDFNIDYARGTIQLLHNGYDGAPLTVQYQYNTGQFRGEGDNENALRIAQLRDAMTMDPDVLQNPTSTFTEYYSSVVGKLGLQRNEAGANLQTRNFLIEQYNTQQDSISGVSLDEEMANIIKFQHSFAAAARLITTTSQMLEVLMNM
jgi:flagellar hook-associated protein 1 FlgK